MKLNSMIATLLLSGLPLVQSANAADLAGPLPDPTHIPIKFAQDLKWPVGKTGEMSIPLFGDPNKAGIYGQLLRWDPGNNSKPHFHSTDRFIYVVSGTWWVSASKTYDRSKMFPVPAGSFVTDIHDTVHWDGAKASTGPCVLLLVGEGPMATTHLVPGDTSKSSDGQEFVTDKDHKD